MPRKYFMRHQREKKTGRVFEIEKQTNSIFELCVCWLIDRPRVWYTFLQISFFSPFSISSYLSFLLSPYRFGWGVVLGLTRENSIAVSPALVAFELRIIFRPTSMSREHRTSRKKIRGEKSAPFPSFPDFYLSLHGIEIKLEGKIELLKID